MGWVTRLPPTPLTGCLLNLTRCLHGTLVVGWAILNLALLIWAVLNKAYFTNKVYTGHTSLPRFPLYHKVPPLTLTGCSPGTPSHGNEWLWTAQFWTKQDLSTYMCPFPHMESPLSHGAPLEQGLSRPGRCNASRVITHTMAGWINCFRSSSMFSMETNDLNKISPYFGLHGGFLCEGESNDEF